MIAGIERINLVPDEIVLIGSSVVLETAGPIDADRLERTVGVRGLAGRLALDEGRRRLTWTPSRHTEPGWSEFSIDELTSDGRRTTAGGRLRFGLVRSAAKVPPSVTIESMVRLHIDGWHVERLPLFENPPREESFVELMKASDRRSGERGEGGVRGGLYGGVQGAAAP